MEGDGDACFQGGGCRADLSGPLHAEVFDMGVTPVIHVSHEKGDDGPQPGGKGELIQAHQLAVDDDWAQSLQCRKGFLGLLKAAQVLGGGAVAIYMGQNLGVFPGGQGEGLQHGLVGHGGIAAEICANVGAAHPGGTALGRAVKEDF